MMFTRDLSILLGHLAVGAVLAAAVHAESLENTLLLDLTGTSWWIPLSAPLRKIRNVMRGVIQRWGTPAMKRRLWDWEFRHGRWVGLDNPEDPLFLYVGQYANGGRVLDLGCGPGSTGRRLDPSRYRSYVGVDVSQIAIEQAREKDRRSQNTYVQSDIMHYRPDDSYDVIVLGDSLYYIPPSEALGTLRRFAECLAAGGVVIVKMHDVPRYRSFFQLIRDHFAVVAEYSLPPVVIIVFRL
jgi:SAM-dependent methyltransferase